MRQLKIGRARILGLHGGGGIEVGRQKRWIHGAGQCGSICRGAGGACNQALGAALQLNAFAVGCFRGKLLKNKIK